MFNWSYEELPKPTVNLETAKSNIDEFGYCLLADALPAEQLAAVRARLEEQAAAELRAGFAFEDGGAKQQWGDFTDDEGRIKRDAFSAAAGGVNQRVWMLINKGKAFIDLLGHPDMRAVVGHVLGNDYLLSSYGANIAKPGGIAMDLHTDQWWMPEPIHRRPSPVPAGSLTRELSNRADDHPAMIAPPVVVNVMWMLNDFTEANGATRLAPRSHLIGRRPDKDRNKDVISTAAYPAKAARLLGWTRTALMGFAEADVKDGLPMCIRVLIHWNTDKPLDEIRHVFLRGAVVLRPDIK